MMKKVLQGTLFTSSIVFVSFLYLLFRYFPKDFGAIILTLDLEAFLWAFLFLFLYHTFDMLRVIVIARAIGLYYPISYGYLVSLVNTFGATVTPAHLGGEILPLYTLSRRGGEIYQIATVVTLKGLSGLIFYLLFLPLTLKALWANPKLAKELLLIVFSILLLSFTLYLGYLFFKDRRDIIRREKKFFIHLKKAFTRYLVTCRRFYRQRKGTFALAVLLSLALYLCFLAIGVYLLKAFNPQAPTFKLITNQLPLLYAIFISPTPGGSGVGEFGAIPVFSVYLPEGYLGIFVIIWRWLSQYLSALLGGIIFLFFLSKDVAEFSKRN